MDSRKYTFNNSTLTVKFGNILDSKAEVIVSSSGTDLSMGTGVSGAILKEGGMSIKSDVRKLQPVQPGDVIVTTAGNLEYQKYVYHCITITKDLKMRMLASLVTEEDVLIYILQHAVDRCFQLMLAMEMTSIAFPAIGAGGAGIPVRMVIEQMSIAFARNLANTNRSLNVELYLYDLYNLYSESDYITLFESLAAKAALVEFNKGLITDDGCLSAVQVDNAQLPLRENMSHEVFISYSRKDKEIAEFVSDVLKENSIKYWIDKEGIYSSYNYKELIVDAIEVAKAVIFISSENSNSSVNVIREIGYAVNMNKPILPLMLDDAPYAKSIRLDISDIDQIDFRKPALSSKKLITSLMYVLNRQ